MTQMIKRTLRASRVWGLTLALYLVLVPVSLQADPLIEQDVSAAVTHWVRHMTADARPDAVIEKMEPYSVDGKTVAYIAQLAGGGFCLCGADDLVLPVYLYSPQGAYKEDNPDFRYVLWEIATRSEKLTEATANNAPELEPYKTALAERALFWQDLIAGSATPAAEDPKAARGEPAQMELPLTSNWHQSSPYNDQCPNLTPGEDEHAVVGCVATALSQLLYYWKWPNTGQGDESQDYLRHGSTSWVYEPFPYDPNVPSTYGKSGELQWVSSDGGQLRMRGYWDYNLKNVARAQHDTDAYRTAVDNLWGKLPDLSTSHEADFGATNYNWSIMADVHEDPPDGGDAEVAKLCYHAGIAVHMFWSVVVSTSNFAENGVNALKNNFRYDQDALHLGASDIYEMAEEIRWLRPIAWEGCGTPGCHAWVAYGYNKGTDPDRSFLMNMGTSGWGGYHIWYVLSGVPFPSDRCISGRIAPLDVVKFVGAANPGDGSPDDPYEHIEEAIVNAPSGATLIFKAGSVNTFAASPLVIDRPLTLKGYEVRIQRQ